MPQDQNLRLSIDAATFQTNVPNIFAGGDATAGPATVIDAIAAGKEIAVSIDRYLRYRDIRLDRVKNLQKIEKIPKEEEFKKQPIWNFENGFVFQRAILDEVVLQCVEEAKHAVLALGLNIGAVDVAIDQRNLAPVVFEVNSAPSLREQHIERYSEILRRVIRNMAREMTGYLNIFENEV